MSTLLVWDSDRAQGFELDWGRNLGRKQKLPIDLRLLLAHPDDHPSTGKHTGRSDAKLAERADVLIDARTSLFDDELAALADGILRIADDRVGRYNLDARTGGLRIALARNEGARRMSVKLDIDGSVYLSVTPKRPGLSGMSMAFEADIEALRESAEDINRLLVKFGVDIVRQGRHSQDDRRPARDDPSHTRRDSGDKPAGRPRGGAPSRGERGGGRDEEEPAGRGGRAGRDENVRRSPRADESDDEFESDEYSGRSDEVELSDEIEDELGIEGELFWEDDDHAIPQNSSPDVAADDAEWAKVNKRWVDENRELREKERRERMGSRPRPGGSRGGPGGGRPRPGGSRGGGGGGGGGRSR